MYSQHSSADMRRRALLAAGLGVFGASCTPNSNIPAISSIYSAARLATEGGKDITLSRKKISSIPYASCYARVGDGPRAFLILSRVDGENLLWVSAQREVLVTRHGRIIQTIGLKSNLDATLDPPPFNEIISSLRLSEPGKDLKFDRSVDFRKFNLYGLQIHSALSQLGHHEDIEIAELVFRTLPLVESNHAPSVDWTFKNYFWSDINTGFIWKSIQTVSPELPPITMVILKPPSL